MDYEDDAVLDDEYENEDEDDDEMEIVDERPHKYLFSDEGRALMERTMTFIERHPEQFNMEDWFEYNSVPRRTTDDDSLCGSSGCLAGTTVCVALEPDLEHLEDKPRNQMWDWMVKAWPQPEAEKLDVTPNRWERESRATMFDKTFFFLTAAPGQVYHPGITSFLTSWSDWPEPFKGQYSELQRQVASYLEDAREELDALHARVRHAQALVACARTRHFLATGE